MNRRLIIVAGVGVLAAIVAGAVLIATGGEDQDDPATAAQAIAGAVIAEGESS